jgi:hypothetical protein
VRFPWCLAGRLDLAAPGEHTLRGGGCCGAAEGRRAFRSIGDDVLGLLGTLDTFTLSDALLLLGATRKTGRLHIEGERRHGAVWLDDGAMVEATIDRRVGGESDLAEMVFEMLRLEEGSFRFVPDDPPPATNRPPEEIEETIARATELLDEWRQLAVTVPSLNHRVAIASDLPDPEVTIDRDRWTTLVAIADRPTVLEVARTLGLGELDVVRTIVDLVDVGIAVVEPPSRATIPRADGRASTGEIAIGYTTTSDPLSSTGSHPFAPAPGPHFPTGGTPAIAYPPG